jgi:hypothetical protein
VLAHVHVVFVSKQIVRNLHAHIHAPTLS